MLTGLHGSVSGGDHQNSAIHLGGTGDHVLNKVRVTWAINVSVGDGWPSHTHVSDGDRYDLEASRTVPPFAMSA